MPPRAWKILSAVGLAVYSPAVAQMNPEAAALYDSYENCASLAAQRYATGIDAADLVAKAATESCTSQRAALAQIMQRAGVPDPLANNMIEQFEIKLIRKLKLFVLDSRAKK